MSYNISKEAMGLVRDAKRVLKEAKKIPYISGTPRELIAKINRYLEEDVSLTPPEEREFFRQMSLEQIFEWRESLEKRLEEEGEDC